jgi:hypothetical protein
MAAHGSGRGCGFGFVAELSGRPSQLVIFVRLQHVAEQTHMREDDKSNEWTESKNDK